MSAQVGCPGTRCSNICSTPPSSRKLFATVNCTCVPSVEPWRVRSCKSKAARSIKRLEARGAAGTSGAEDWGPSPHLCHSFDETTQMCHCVRADHSANVKVVDFFFLRTFFRVCLWLCRFSHEGELLITSGIVANAVRNSFFQPAPRHVK